MAGKGEDAVTCAELYQTDPGFRGFIAAWVEEKRCPLPLVDYLLDRDLEAPAEAARWAATAGNRSWTDDTDENAYPYPG